LRGLKAEGYATNDEIVFAEDGDMSFLGVRTLEGFSVKEEKAQKQHLGILEKMSMLSDGKKAQIKEYMEQAVTEEQQQPAEMDNTPSKHGN
jgi:hypothetical protein